LNTCFCIKLLVPMQYVCSSTGLAIENKTVHYCYIQNKTHNTFYHFLAVYQVDTSYAPCIVCNSFWAENVNFFLVISYFSGHHDVSFRK
jgi:hypothetical protein